MGASGASMLARRSSLVDESKRLLLAPSRLKLLVAKSDQGLGHVIPITALRPGHNQCSGRKRQGLIEREARPHVIGADGQIGVKENPPGFRSRRRIGPIFWHRWRQMPAVLAKVETGLCLDKILDIDKAEMGPVIKKLVVFVVAVGRNGCLRRHAIGSSADLLEKIAEPHIDSGRRHLEFLEAIQKTVDLHIYGVRVPSADAGAVNVSDGPPCRFTLRQEDIRTAIALDLFSTNLRLTSKVEFW